jgi:hypothetical protein
MTRSWEEGGAGRECVPGGTINLVDVCVCRKFWVASKEAPILYLFLFLALAHEAIAAIAPPELIDRMAYIA